MAPAEEEFDTVNVCGVTSSMGWDALRLLLPLVEEIEAEEEPAVPEYVMVVEDS